MKIGTYIHWSYILRLTNEYNLYSSVMKICSSVITNEHFDVSCSDTRAVVVFLVISGNILEEYFTSGPTPFHITPNQTRPKILHNLIVEDERGVDLPVVQNHEWLTRYVVEIRDLIKAYKKIRNAETCSLL
jgi:hypothetical protein